MNEFLCLYIILIAIYLFDCCLWSGRRSIAFKSSFGRTWILSEGMNPIDSDHLKTFFCNPIPPLGTIFLAENLPVTLSRWGIGVAEEQIGLTECDFLPFSELKTVSFLDKYLVLNDFQFCECISSERARQLVTFLEYLRSLPCEKRERAIVDELHSITNIAEIKSRLNEFRINSVGLRYSCNVLFCFIFLIVPIGFLIDLRAYVWLVLIASLIVLESLILAQFWKAHALLFPHAWKDKWTSLISMALSPPGAIRAVDAISADLLVRFQPLAISSVVSTELDFRRYASETLRTLCFPLEHRFRGQVFNHDSEHRKCLRECIERLLASTGLNLSTLMGEIPFRDSIAVESYCPRCWTQYVAGITVCVECEIKTIAFSPL
jgi:hypothetical protein